MPIIDQSYQPYRGSYQNRLWKIWAISMAGLSSVRKSRWLPYLLFSAALPFLSMISRFYLALYAEQFGLPVDKLLPKTTDAQFFHNFLMGQRGFLFFSTLWIGSSLIAEDLASSALPLYLARPLSKLDYVLGKLLAVGSLGTVVVVLPAFLLWAALASGTIPVTTALPTLADGWNLLVLGFFMVFGDGILALALSSLTHSSRNAGMAFAALYFVPDMIQGFVNTQFQSEWWALFSLPDLYKEAGKQILLQGGSLPMISVMVLLSMMAVSGMVLYYRVSVRSKI